MTELTIIYWRDIPAQVVAKQGRKRSRRALTPRFQQGIDRAAMRAKKIDTDAYLEDWRRESTRLEGELEALVQAAADRLEQEYDELRLERIVRNKGLDPAPAGAEA